MLLSLEIGPPVEVTRFSPLPPPLFIQRRGRGLLRTSPITISPNFALKLSEKGFERRSERGIGRYIGAKIGRTVRCRGSVQLSFGCLQDFSDSFLTEFSEVRSMRRAGTPPLAPALSLNSVLLQMVGYSFLNPPILVAVAVARYARGWPWRPLQRRPTARRPIRGTTSRAAPLPSPQEWRLSRTLRDSRA